MLSDAKVIPTLGQIAYSMPSLPPLVENFYAGFLQQICRENRQRLGCDIAVWHTR